jgi:hypothetical protein
VVGPAGAVAGTTGNTEPGLGGAGGINETPDAGEGTDVTVKKSDGCSCNLAGRSERGGALLAFLVLAVATVLRPRRARKDPLTHQQG